MMLHAPDGLDEFKKKVAQITEYYTKALRAEQEQKSTTKLKEQVGGAL